MAAAPRVPNWVGPPAGVLGSPALSRIILYQSAETSIAAERVTTFPMGVAFHVVIADRRNLDALPFLPFKPTAPENERFRIGLELSDHVVVWGHGPAEAHPSAQPSGPSLLYSGGHGQPGRWDLRYWLYPLPPPGPLTFLVSCVGLTIPETRTTVDAGPIIDEALDTTD